ncbi:MAG: hypothetical protein Q9226_008409 [Calogaya cf. arnoldii]
MQLTHTTLLALLTASASSEGINCKGSSECYRGGGSAASRLNSFIQAGPNDRWFDNKQQIACVDAGSGADPGSAICAYLQNTGGAPLRNIKGLAPRILEHNCKNCGSNDNAPESVRGSILQECSVASSPVKISCTGCHRTRKPGQQDWQAPRWHKLICLGWNGWLKRSAGQDVKKAPPEMKPFMEAQMRTQRERKLAQWIKQMVRQLAEYEAALPTTESSRPAREKLKQIVREGRELESVYSKKQFSRHAREKVEQFLRRIPELPALLNIEESIRPAQNEKAYSSYTTPIIGGLVQRLHELAMPQIKSIGK